MEMMKRSLAAMWVSAALVLTACGGGDSGGPVTPPGATATELPATVTISTGAAATDVDTAAAFTTNITGSTSGLRFAWAFGDGATSTEAAPVHSYAAGGDYVVTLTVTNEASVSRTSTFTVAARRTAIVAGTVCSGASQTGWCWQRPKPTGGTTGDLFFLDATTGWSVGDAGQILKTTDGGATWVGQRSNVTARLTQVRFANASTGWAVGDGATIVKTTDGGATWVAQASGVSSPLYYGSATLTVLDSTRAVVDFTGFGQTRVTTDGGEHWNASVLTAAAITANGTMWSVDYNSISKSSDSGATATIALQGRMYEQFGGITFVDDQHGWAQSYDYFSYPSQRNLWRTVDGGVTWESIAPTGIPDYASTQGMRFTSANVGWMSSYYSLLRSTDGGASWAALTPPDLYYYIDTPTVFDDNTAWWPTYGGGYLTRDGGATWALVRIEAEQYQGPARLQLAPGGAMWLHFSQRSYRSVDGGSTWQRALGTEALDLDGSLQTAWFFNGSSGLAYSTAGWIVETADAGQTWTRKTLINGPNYGNARLQFASATNGWLMTGGYDQTVSVTTDAGASWWVPLVPVDFGNLIDFHFIDAQLGWAIGFYGRISHSIDGGKTWARQAELSSYRFNGIRFASANVGIAIGSGGILARTADGGAAWALRPTGVPYDLTRAYFADAQTAWAVGVNGTVIKSVDAGITWSKVAVPSNASLNDITFSDAKHGWIVGAGGTVLVTADGGVTWRAQASGTDKALFSAFFIDALSGWLVGAGGTILATASGGN